MKEYIQEKLLEVNQKIIAYESERYSINEISVMENARRECDKLIGEQRTLKMMLQLIENDK